MAASAGNPGPNPGTRSGAGSHRFAVVLLAATFILLVAGGQVTSTESGDAVPTWPFPLKMEMVGGVKWELGHRHVAGLVGVLTLGLALWLARAARRAGGGSREKRALVLGLWALGLVAFQAILGGIRVRLGAADPNVGQLDESLGVRAIAITHASVAQAFLLLVVSIVLATARRPAPHAAGSAPPGLHRLAVAATAVAYVQIVLGAILRHTLSDTGLLLHVGGAFAVLVLGATLAGRALAQSSLPALRRPALLLGAALGLQIVLGILSYALVNQGVPRTPELTIRNVIPTLHLVIGGAILALCHVLAVSSAGARGQAVASAPGSSPLALGGGIS